MGLCRHNSLALFGWTGRLRTSWCWRVLATGGRKHLHLLQFMWAGLVGGVTGRTGKFVRRYKERSEDRGGFVPPGSYFGSVQPQKPVKFFVLRDPSCRLSVSPSVAKLWAAVYMVATASFLPKRLHGQPERTQSAARCNKHHHHRAHCSTSDPPTPPAYRHPPSLVTAPSPLFLLHSSATTQACRFGHETNA